MIQLVVDEELRTLIVSACDSHVVFFVGNIKVGETPVDKSKLLRLLVDNDI